MFILNTVCDYGQFVILNDIWYKSTKAHMNYISIFPYTSKVFGIYFYRFRHFRMLILKYACNFVQFSKKISLFVSVLTILQ